MNLNDGLRGFNPDLKSLDGQTPWEEVFDEVRPGTLSEELKTYQESIQHLRL